MEMPIFLMGYAVIGTVFAVWAGFLADDRGHPFALWFVLGMLFGPIALLIVAFLPNERKRAKAAQAATGNAAPITSVAGELTQLASLRDQGVLTEDEFAAQKAKLLG